MDAVDVWKLFIAFPFFIYEILNSHIWLPIFFDIHCEVGGASVKLFYTFAENGNVSSFLLGLTGCDWPLIWYYVNCFFGLLICVFLVLLVCWKYPSFAILDLLLLVSILNLLSIILKWFFVGLNLNYSCFSRLKHILVSCLNDIIKILLLHLLMCIFNQIHILIFFKLRVSLSFTWLRNIIHFILNSVFF